LPVIEQQSCATKLLLLDFVACLTWALDLTSRSTQCRSETLFSSQLFDWCKTTKLNVIITKNNTKTKQPLQENDQRAQTKPLNNKGTV